MGTDERIPLARRLWRAARRLASERYEGRGGQKVLLSRRVLHQAVRGKTTLTKAEDIDPIIALLVDRYYLPASGYGRSSGQGAQQPHLPEVSPRALAQKEEDAAALQDPDPVSHYPHISQMDRDQPSSERCEGCEGHPREPAEGEGPQSEEIEEEYFQ